MIFLLIDKISTVIDRTEYTIGIFLDLSRAFDAVNHETVLHKLDHDGVKGTALEWLKNYLTNRKQIVNYKSVKSVASLIRLWCNTGISSWSLAVSDVRK